MKRNAGFTLVEVLIVLAILSVLAAVVVPNVSGFLGRGKREAYNADQKTLQLASQTYLLDNSNQPTYCQCGREDPTNGTPTNFADDSYIDASLLVDGNYIDDIPQSATVRNDADASGSYGWYVDSKGKVRSSPVYQQGTYP